MHPRDREALEQAVVRGSELLKQGKIALAQLAFRDALMLEPDNPRVLALLGLSYFRASAFNEARAVYEQLVERAPSDAAHRLNLGVVYLKLNDAERAIAALEASRSLDPSQGRAVSYLGLAYARAGRYADAYRAFLLAGQTELATEIETNLTVAEREQIHVQTGRSPQGPFPEPASADATGSASGLPAGAPSGAAGDPASRAAALPRGLAPPTVSRPVSLPTPRAPAPGASAEPESPGASGQAPASLALRSKPPSVPPGKPVAAAPPEGPDAQDARDARDAPAAAIPGVPRVANGAAVIAPVEARHGDSMQFVMPRVEPAAPTQVLDGASMISRAVASATPAATVQVARTQPGGAPPRPLSDLATDELVRPDEGDEVFEVGPGGALIIRVTDRVLTRLDGVHATGGELAYELALRRSRGHNTAEAFDYGGSQLHAVTGRGYLIAVPGKYAFAAVGLDDDILYLREDLVFAFQASLRWENGNVPGLRGKLPIVQFRGDGAVALRIARPLVRVKLPPQGMVFVDADRLAGWIGRVIPRAVVPPAGGPLGAMCVECTGEGVVLVEPAGDEQVAARTAPVTVASAGPGTPSAVPGAAGARPASPPADAPPESTEDALDRLDEL